MSQSISIGNYTEDAIGDAAGEDGKISVFRKDFVDDLLVFLGFERAGGIDQLSSGSQKG